MFDNSENMEIVDLITRNLSGEATAEEQQQLLQWKESDPSNEKLFQEYKDTWEKMDSARELSRINVDDEWKRMESAMEGEGSTGKVVSMDSDSNIFRLSGMARVAAIFIFLMVSAVVVYYTIDEPQIIIAEAEITRSELPDGSKIVLNRNSTLGYDKTFNKKYRRVTLMGEAFFDIKSDKEKPFIIDAGPVLIKVLGTSFFVNANESEDSIKVIVDEGTVVISNKSDATQEITLNAGDKGAFARKNKKLFKKVNDDENYNSWKTKKLVFKNKRLKNIVKSLNNVYFGNIIIGSEEIEGCRITVTFDQQELKSILNVLKATMDIEVKEEKSSIVISGSGC